MSEFSKLIHVELKQFHKGNTSSVHGLVDCEYGYPTKSNLQIYYNPNQNLYKILYRKKSKIHIEPKKTLSRQSSLNKKNTERIAIVEFKIHKTT